MGKTNRTKERIVIEVPPDLKNWLERHCKEEGHTITWLTTKLLEKYRQERDK
jgi:hypothetical protein